jgi:hypothetical protein
LDTKNTFGMSVQLLKNKNVNSHTKKSLKTWNGPCSIWGGGPGNWDAIGCWKRFCWGCGWTQGPHGDWAHPLWTPEVGTDCE